MAMSDLVFFNVDDGYSEALLRGFRKSILGEQQYTALRNTTNLKDFKSVLIDTDYSDYVKEYNETDTSALKMLLKKKLADEIDQVQSVAGPDLDKFIEMIRHKYMIDNVINIIEGIKNKTDKNVIESRNEPLGYLKEISGLLKLDYKKELKLETFYGDLISDTFGDPKFTPTYHIISNDPDYLKIYLDCPGKTSINDVDITYPNQTTIVIIKGNREKQNKKALGKKFGSGDFELKIVLKNSDADITNNITLEPPIDGFYRIRIEREKKIGMENKKETKQK